MSAPIARIREWLTLGETIATLEKSASTIERAVAAGRIRSKLEPRPGRKPERMYNAGDLERIKDAEQERNLRFPAPYKKPEPKSAAMLMGLQPEMISSLRDVMMEWRNAPIPVTVKLWLTIEEAAAYSGRSRSRLLQWCREGKVTAERDGGWRIHRASLEASAG